MFTVAESYFLGQGNEPWTILSKELQDQIYVYTTPSFSPYSEFVFSELIPNNLDFTSRSDQLLGFEGVTVISVEMNLDPSFKNKKLLLLEISKSQWIGMGYELNW